MDMVPSFYLQYVYRVRNSTTYGDGIRMLSTNKDERMCKKENLFRWCLVGERFDMPVVRDPEGQRRMTRKAQMTIWV